MKKIFLLISHLSFLALGFISGVYFLPILIAPDAPSISEIESSSTSYQFSTHFNKTLQGSDFLHWGEGELKLGTQSIAFIGELAPGPDYKLYLVPEFVQTGPDFLALKAKSVRVGDIKTFKNFIVDVPAGINVEHFNTVVVWCETFSQFITAGKYR